MKIIAIDPSKKRTGIYIKNGEEEYTISIENKYTDTQRKALKNIYTTMQQIIKDYNPEIAIIEGYGINPKNRRSMFVLAEIIGIIKLAMSWEDIPVIIIPVQTWKANTIGNVNKKDKSTYLKIIKNLYGKEFINTDQADAYLIYAAFKRIATKTRYLKESEKKIRTELKNILAERKQIELKGEKRYV